MPRPKSEMIKFENFTIFACPLCHEPRETENELLEHLRECAPCNECKGKGSFDQHVCSKCADTLPCDEECAACEGTGLEQRARVTFDMSPRAIHRLLGYPTYKGYKIAMGRKRR